MFERNILVSFELGVESSKESIRLHCYSMTDFPPLEK